jgi:Flp pilus assembly protein TadG
MTAQNAPLDSEFAVMRKKRVKSQVCQCVRHWTTPVRRLFRREDGTVAIEFGFVAVPFLALVFAIMETALIFFSGQALETAAADSARLIMTGQAQTQGLTQDTFKNAVCSKVHGLFDCAAGVYVDVRTYASFSNINISNPVDANGNLIKDFAYQPGGPGNIVVMRLIYQWPVFVSLLGLNNLSNMSGSNRLLVATVAFRNEPYQ